MTRDEVASTTIAMPFLFVAVVCATACSIAYVGAKACAHEPVGTPVPATRIGAMSAPGPEGDIEVLLAGQCGPHWGGLSRYVRDPRTGVCFVQFATAPPFSAPATVPCEAVEGALAGDGAPR